jgi:cytoskeletal protein CcmA (bactofilin family)
VKDSGALIALTIGEGLTITRNVTSKAEIHFEGHLEGDIHCVALVLGETSNVEGNVTADDVLIRGRFVGSVRALRVMLQSTSYVEGDLIHAGLAIEQGAYFEGESHRSESPLSTNQTTAKNLEPSKPKPATHVPDKKKEKPEAALCDHCPNWSNERSLCV